MSDSVVYFVQAGDFIKIGTTTNLRARLAALQNGCPFPVILLGTVQGDVQVEQALQRQFDEFHIRGEWFDAAPALREYIEKGAAPAPREHIEKNVHLQRPPRRVKPIVTRPPVFKPSFPIEPQDGVVTVRRQIVPHISGEDVIVHIKFHAYIVIGTVVESNVSFDMLIVRFTYPLEGHEVEVARASFTRDDCLHIVTPDVHLFGALEHAEAVYIHPAFDRWAGFPRIVMGPHGRPIVAL